jgi:hypothetical protein
MAKLKYRQGQDDAVQQDSVCETLVYSIIEILSHLNDFLA